MPCLEKALGGWPVCLSARVCIERGAQLGEGKMRGVAAFFRGPGLCSPRHPVWDGVSTGSQQLLCSLAADPDLTSQVLPRLLRGTGLRCPVWGQEGFHRLGLVAAPVQGLRDRGVWAHCLVTAGPDWAPLAHGGKQLPHLHAPPSTFAGSPCHPPSLTFHPLPWAPVWVEEWGPRSGFLSA